MPKHIFFFKFKESKKLTFAFVQKIPHRGFLGKQHFAKKAINASNCHKSNFGTKKSVDWGKCGTFAAKS
jgi:hypothetical protein